MPVKKIKKKARLLDRAKPIEDLKINLRMLVYGKADTGKTYFASTWPKPILFIGFREEGMDTVKGQKDIEILELENWEEFEDLYWELLEGTEFKSIVLDQITSAQGFAIDHVREKAKKKPGELMTQKNWGQVSGMMKTYVENYRNLSDQYNVCFLAHERTFNVSSDEEESLIDPHIGAATMPSVNTFLTGAVSAIGNTFIREEWDEDPKTKEEIRRVEFCMRTGPAANYFTKIRRPPEWGQVPEYIVNPTYEKISDLINNKSTSKPRRRKVNAKK